LKVSVGLREAAGVVERQVAILFELYLWNTAI
jgi:hypothetical protein